MTSRRFVSTLVAALAVLCWAAPAEADPPARLTAQVTDPAGVLGTRRGAVDAALDRLRAQTGVRLFVVFVPSFDGPSAQSWTDGTARLSGLGDDTALLAVATRDREYAYHVPPGSRITKGEAAAVARNDIEPALTRGDWPGAVIAAADGYRRATTGSGSFTWVIVLAIVVIAAVGAGALFRRRRQNHSVVADDDGRADDLLVEVDNDVRARLAAGMDVAAATAELTEAFRLRMTLDRTSLDDELALTAASRSATLTAIVDHCTAAGRHLAALDPPAGPDEIDRRRVALEAAIPAAAAALQDLIPRYAESLVDLVSANVGQARERLAFAANALLHARAGTDADALRAAEQAVDQADQLLTAIHRVAADGDSPEIGSLAAVVDDFISTRRGAVGIGSRIAISEARRHLARATAVDGGDPKTSLAESQLARTLTERAAGSAVADVEAWPGFVSTDGLDRNGAILGGILPARSTTA